MKIFRKTIAGLLFFSLLTMSSCDINAGRRPSNYPDTLWTATADDIVISFTVTEETAGFRVFYGSFQRDKDTIDICGKFDYGNGVYFATTEALKYYYDSSFPEMSKYDIDYSVTAAILFEGYCTYGPNEFTIQKARWGESYQQFREITELTFTREVL
ncbi:MAG: hypothetical protein LBO63_01075 [Oscillospiraceae bacterium]|jgi:hypothetical protein|nr:hypothetical protein [Oscillospiraceae bacterium]